MAITTYAELQTAVGNWLERSGETEVTDRVAEWIDLGEAELNRELLGLRITKVNTTALTGTLSSRNISLSSLTFLAPVALVLTSNSVQKRLRRYTSGTRALGTTNGPPSAWTIVGSNIELDRPCDQAHTFSFYYHSALDLATDLSNFILTNYPDAYLFKALKHASIYFRDPEGVAAYHALAAPVVDQIKAIELKNQESELGVDAALMSRGNGIDYSTFAGGDF